MKAAVPKPIAAKTAPALKGKPAVRLPQRSEAVSGDAANGEASPIAAAQKKTPKPK
jgi:hypothetical protein